MKAAEGITRRDALRRGGAAVALVAAPGLLSACGEDEPDKRAPAQADKQTVTSKEVIWADYGGETRKVREEIFFAPLREQHGVRVVSTTLDQAKFFLQAERGRSQVDLADLDGFVAVALVGSDLVQKLPSSVPPAVGVTGAELQRYCAGGYAYSQQFGYAQGTFKGAQPESWSDFWDVSRFPGKRVMSKSYVGKVEAALIADGVAPEQLYPLDFDRAFAKLTELRPNILFVDSLGAAQQALVAGAGKLAYMTNGRFFDLITRGERIQTVWNEALLYPWSAAPVPVGAPHSDAAFALLEIMSRPDLQAKFADRLAYGPTVEGALELVAAKTRAELPTAPENLEVAVRTDAVQLAGVDADYFKRFQEWLGS